MTHARSALLGFGQRLRSFRKDRAWSQEELARRTGRHWTYIGGLERGERNPTLLMMLDLAAALRISPAELVDHAQATQRHPVTEKLGACADDVLEAISRGFRAQIDVKGKLAELFMSRTLEALLNERKIERFEWQDRDGRPDFVVRYRGHDLNLECKNIRNETFKCPPAYKVELQRTRNSKDGTPTRGYRVDEFDVLGVSLFNQIGRWEFAYIATRQLERRPNLREFLVVMQRVPIDIQEPWSREPLVAFENARKGC